LEYDYRGDNRRHSADIMKVEELEELKEVGIK